MNDNACCRCVHEYGTRLCLQKKKKKRRGRYIKKPAPAPGRGVSSPRLHSMYVSVWVTGGGPFEVAKPCRCVLKVSTSLTPLLQALNNGILNMHTFKADWATEPGGANKNQQMSNNEPPAKENRRTDTQRSHASLHLQRKIRQEQQA